MTFWLQAKQEQVSGQKRSNDMTPCPSAHWFPCRLVEPILVGLLLFGGCADLQPSGTERVVASPSSLGSRQLASLTAAEALALLQSGELTSLEYVDALLDRSSLHADYHAFIYLNPDQVRQEARHSDELRASGIVLGPLHGLPIVLKDNIDTAAMPTTAGSPALASNRPTRNAPVAQALLDAGAILFAKANMHEMAAGVTTNNATFGQARNPRNKTRIPGGSSGGNGTAIGGRLVPAGLGTDTGGSVRIPSSLCGIVGLRPTSGRYSNDGIVPLSRTRDTAGPMARSVEDVALLDAVVTGAPAAIEPASLAGLRLGVPRAYFYDNLAEEVARAFEDRLQQLRGAGVELVEADLPQVQDLVAATSFPILFYEAVRDLNEYLSSHNTGLDFASLAPLIASPDVKRLFEQALANPVPSSYYQYVMGVLRPTLQQVYQQYFAAHGVRAIIFPTTPLPAANIGDDVTTELNGQLVTTMTIYMRNTDPGSVAGIPGLSLPQSLSDGLPFGIEIDGPADSDRQLLAIGLALQRQLPPAQ
jgi:Asp-tRNA(Asn)/Glu-tRNA(Gln) amidotransferase A subunit family amidase